MILTNLIKRVVRGGHETPLGEIAGQHLEVHLAVEPTAERPAVLNVGGASKQIPIPEHYRGWHHLLLDIKPGSDVDVVKDARELLELPASRFDAIYCSHNLEHYYRHDARKVLAGFVHVLKPDGFAEIRVPDMQAVFKSMTERGLDIDDVLYVSPAGPITVHDVIYGWGKEIESSGVDFYAHKQGYTTSTLTAALQASGFNVIYVMKDRDGLEIRALAFKSQPSKEQQVRFGIPTADSLGG
jgi:SAM-dependent methyltransferase